MVQRERNNQIKEEEEVRENKQEGWGERERELFHLMDLTLIQRDRLMTHGKDSLFFPFICGSTTVSFIHARASGGWVRVGLSERKGFRVTLSV